VPRGAAGRRQQAAGGRRREDGGRATRFGMSWQTWLAAALIVLAGALQYGLMAYALRDLRHRPRVRGENKVLWGLVILCVPFAGALAYAVYGPTSFRDRPPPAPADPARRRALSAGLPWPADDEDGLGEDAASPPPRRVPRRPTAGQGDA
jgi:hypothetical protein